ncbi:MAG: phage holin, LLH family [Desulfomonilaceae bacterium]
MSGIEILYGVVGLLLGLLLKDYLPSYAKKKGENLATRKDIGPITEIVEKVKQEHNEKLEEVKSYLAAAIHRHNIGFQTEFEVYKKSWKTVVDLQAAMKLFQPGGYFAEPNETYEQRGRRLGAALSKASTEFAGIILYNRPFYSPKIFVMFNRFQRFVYKEAILYNMEYIGKTRQLARLDPRRLDRVVRALGRQAETICKAMRKRVVALQRDGE